MRNRRLLTIAFATGSMLAVSGIAFAVVQSVDSTPAPQVVIPASATVENSPSSQPIDDRGQAGHGADDPAGHDATDDNGVDNPATHEVGDDNGTASGGDDPAGHDATDDNGGTTTSGGGSGGSDDSGSGSGSSGGSGGGSGGHGSDG